jgi:geranylgeranyl reductase family protein
MSERLHDIVVVGAGPSGSCAAMKCAEAGLRVLILDRETFPRDKACGGVVGESTVRIFGKDILSVSECEATRNDFFYDWEDIGHIDKREHFFKRRKLDHYLVKKAIESGAELREAVQAAGVTISRDKAVVHTTVGDFEAQIVVAADGMSSAIGHSLGLTHQADLCRYASMKAEPEVTPRKAAELGVMDPPRQQTHFFSDLMGFAWVIPNSGSVNAGYGSTVDKSEGLKERFHKFLGHLGLEPQMVRGGQIPFMTIRRVYAERVLFTGDAAGFVNPWTGAGIDQGVMASEKAAAVCKAACDSQDFSSDKMSTYQTLCAAQVRRTNWRGSWIKALDCLIPRGTIFPFWFRFLVKRFSNVI